MSTARRLAVFAVRATKAGSTWVRAGTATVTQSGSLDIELDVLPLDGRLHISAVDGTGDLFPEVPHRCESGMLRGGLERQGIPVTFTCTGCGQEHCAACQTSADEHPDLCNVCWARSQEARPA